MDLEPFPELFIHLFSVPIILHRVVGSLEPIPGTERGTVVAVIYIYIYGMDSWHEGENMIQSFKSTVFKLQEHCF